jgi:hypothetical protein
VLQDGASGIDLHQESRNQQTDDRYENSDGKSKIPIHRFSLSVSLVK